MQPTDRFMICVISSGNPCDKVTMTCLRSNACQTISDLEIVVSLIDNLLTLPGSSNESLGNIYHGPSQLFSTPPAAHLKQP